MTTITRTIKSTNAVISIYDRDNKVMDEMDITLAGEFTDDSAIIKIAQRQFPDHIKVIDVLAKTVNTAKYAMDINTFIKYAIKED